MAFSIFLRKPVCSSRMFTQQVMRLATQPSLSYRAVSSTLPRSLALQKASTTPILNSVRSFQTSMVRKAAGQAHDHTKLWVIERITAVALVALIPAALMMPNKFLDSVLAVLVTAHSFWGLEAVVVDYVRASIFGPVIPKLAIGLVYLLSIATLGGLFYMIGRDIGISNNIRKFWAIGSEKA